MTDKKKYPFQIRFKVEDSENVSEEPVFVKVEIEAYTLNAACDRLGRALTSLCERTP